MNALNDVVADALRDFEKVAALAWAECLAESITVEIAANPHQAPKTLPIGKMAVHAFVLNEEALKVGKVGPNSPARYTSQHYNPGSADFRFPKQQGRTIYCLRFDHPLWNPLQMRLKLDAHVPQKGITAKPEIGG